jgi:regulator of sigma E protease
MSFFDALANIPVLTLLFNIAAFIVALTIIVFVHEYGHFIVGRWCGVGIQTFSVGFGKELFGFNDKHGTRWKFAALPFGGFVKFEGDANAASMPDKTVAHSPTSLHGKSVPQRMAIVAAGPIANFILAIFLFTMGAMIVGYPYTRAVVSEVLPGSAAAVAGFKAGDEIKRIDGQEIVSFEGVLEAVFLRPGEALKIEVQRNGQIVDLTATPQLKEERDSFGGIARVGQLGIRHNRAADEPLYEPLGPVQAFSKGVERTWATISLTGKFIGKLFTGKQSVDQVGGAIMIGKHAGDAASSGPLYFVYFLALLSISVGIINLFPIPMLDGGHLVFYAIEGVLGRPLGPTAQEWGFRIGFSCVVMLMLLGLFNDTGRVLNVLLGT